MKWGKHPACHRLSTQAASLRHVVTCNSGSQTNTEGIDSDDPSREIGQILCIWWRERLSLEAGVMVWRPSQFNPIARQTNDHAID